MAFRQPPDRIQKTQLIRRFGRVMLARSPAPIPLAASGGQERSKLAHESGTSLECGFRAHPRSGITSLAGIAAALNARGVRTARDGEWHASTVRNLLAGSTLNGKRAICHREPDIETLQAQRVV